MNDINDEQIDLITNDMSQMYIEEEKVDIFSSNMLNILEYFSENNNNNNNFTKSEIYSIVQNAWWSFPVTDNENYFLKCFFEAANFLNAKKYVDIEEYQSDIITILKYTSELNWNLSVSQTTNDQKQNFVTPFGVIEDSLKVIDNYLTHDDWKHSTNFLNDQERRNYENSPHSEKTIFPHHQRVYYGNKFQSVMQDSDDEKYGSSTIIFNGRKMAVLDE